ncbi:hypothetical protein M758_1G124900 [Ceratodon purpureus]|uniref:Uncharacterized protein n=1 Tax=Ceratodon purpureus TaxID=3225 RepID=A0A8T0J4I1_CERPU|nr:hypothetical protein KC19_1G129300 [Ceratodon purpureus]KAG0629714.1 hypothetical protein M758_1G124900 [Ceratodon purpureus]
MAATLLSRAMEYATPLPCRSPKSLQSFLNMKALISDVNNGLYDLKCVIATRMVAPSCKSNTPPRVKLPSTPDTPKTIHCRRHGLSQRVRAATRLPRAMEYATPHPQQKDLNHEGLKAPSHESTDLRR